ncbi:MAG: AFG1/ZapE family ATPase, partial [Candidatus Sedimenticola sp. 6PFRAG5]
IPRLGPALDDATRRFLYLVDEFYDRNVKLIVSAAEPPESLYQGERLAFDFKRAVSRLQEMQSTSYLAKAHRTH